MITLLHHMAGGALLRIATHGLQTVVAHVCNPMVRAAHEPVLKLQLLASDSTTDKLCIDPKPESFEALITELETQLLGCEDLIQPVWGDVLEQNLPKDMFEPSLRLTMHGDRCMMRVLFAQDM
jgi:hypothetical protein